MNSKTPRTPPREIAELSTRRRFLGYAALGTAHLWWGMTRGVAHGSGQPVQRIVDRQPWAYLVELSEGVWAVVSTPLESDDWTTGCNGGLIAGKERVVAIESFVRPAGATWLVEQASVLAGRPPTDVVLTHFHGDHVNGLEGYGTHGSPTVWATRTTLDLIRDEDGQREQPPSELRQRMLDGARLLDPREPLPLDLGGRQITLHPRHGHTPSDVTIELAEPSIVFAGDLVWNGIFPNYRDTEASAFTHSIHALRRQQDTTYISGHGALAKGSDVDRLLRLVEAVAEAAERAHQQGVPLAAAAAAFSLPAEVSEWTLFNPKYFEVAFKAWYEELGQPAGALVPRPVRGDFGTDSRCCVPV